MDELQLAANNGLPSINFVEANEVGLSAINADDFMTLLITQLQYQDPTEPMSNDAILSQVSQMQSLQSSVELTDTLEGLANSQNLSQASTMIGLSITGRNAEGTLIDGVVDRALLRDGRPVVSVGGEEVSVLDVESISTPQATAAA